MANENGPYHRLVMVRPDLHGIPEARAAGSYAIRWYEPGDERHWVRIQAAADLHNAITPELFTRQFGTDAAVLSLRMAFLCGPDGHAIGSASAWFGQGPWGAESGRVHWVAVLPEFQGRGLSKPLLAAVCVRLRELGHSRAYLTTATVRIAALNLYLRFGFVPQMASPRDVAAWESVRPWLRVGEAKWDSLTLAANAGDAALLDPNGRSRDGPQTTPSVEDRSGGLA